MRHPDMFGVAASLGGEYNDYESRQTGTLFGPRGRARDSLINSYDLLWRLRTLPAPDVRVLVATTAHGERDYASTEQFMAAAKEPMRVTPLVLTNGGHNFTTWTLELQPALVWMGRQMTPPPASPPPPAATARAPS